MNELFLDKEQIAKLLKTDKKTLEEFEKKYNSVLKNESLDNPFEINAKQAAEMKEGIVYGEYPKLDDLMNRIVNELLAKTPVWEFDGKKVSITNGYLEASSANPVTSEEVMSIPEDIRPQLTGNLMKKDMSEPSYPALLAQYLNYKRETNLRKRGLYYGLFRQGMDILDLDPVIYEMLGMNQNNMGNWLPEIIDSVLENGFFKIPKTTIIKVPITMLQLTRLGYMTLTRTTLDIANKFCQKVFHLEEDKDYFIKTGIYSSKFDFRNAHIQGAKEVREIGEYLLYLQSQATMMAGPLTKPSIYGIATTNEWVVREFIEDKENNPCIYKGLPLHTEYRVFVDFDTKEILGISPYWKSDIMKKRFGHANDADSPHNMHDYIIYSMHEETLMKRYDDNKDRIQKELLSVVKNAENLHGQWSIDIMQNGDDFWLIDMALASDSALKECVPDRLLKKQEENWIPRIEEETVWEDMKKEQKS